MKLQQRLAAYFCSLFTLVSLTANALASCPVMDQGPPCQAYWRADAVFIGVASRVVNVPNDTDLMIGPYLRTTAYFTIEEAFKGAGGTSLVFDSTDCGYLFKEGERYLVYAHRNPNDQKLEVRVGNTRTRPLTEAIEDLAYLRGLASAEPGSRVFGRVAHYKQNIREASYDSEPLQNLKVTLEGNNVQQEVNTDSEGRYEFRRLPAGTYRIRAEISGQLTYQEPIVKVIGRECAPVNIPAWDKGVIGGRVLNSEGKPLRGVAISIVLADARHEQIFSEVGDRKSWNFSTTDEKGRYSFTQLPPGRYLLIINRTEFESSRAAGPWRTLPRLFYPGVNDVSGATVIVVENGREAQKYEFRLPVQ